jgi:hypothetical protein
MILLHVISVSQQAPARLPLAFGPAGMLAPGFQACWGKSILKSIPNSFLISLCAIAETIFTRISMFRF